MADAPPSTRSSVSGLPYRVHGIEHVGHLEGDALQGGAGDVARLRAAAKANDQAAGVRIPVRRAQAGKGGHEDDAIGVW